MYNSFKQNKMQCIFSCHHRCDHETALYFKLCAAALIGQNIAMASVYILSSMPGFYNIIIIFFDFPKENFRPNRCTQKRRSRAICDARAVLF